MRVASSSSASCRSSGASSAGSATALGRVRQRSTCARPRSPRERGPRIRAWHRTRRQRRDCPRDLGPDACRSNSTTGVTVGGSVTTPSGWVRSRRLGDSNRVVVGMGRVCATTARCLDGSISREARSAGEEARRCGQRRNARWAACGFRQLVLKAGRGTHLPAARLISCMRSLCASVMPA